MSDMTDADFEAASAALEEGFTRDTERLTKEFDELDVALDKAFGAADAAFEDLRKDIAEGTDE